MIKSILKKTCVSILCMPWYFSIYGHNPITICCYYSEVKTDEYIKSISKVVGDDGQDTSCLLSSGINTEDHVEILFFDKPLVKNTINHITVQIQEFNNEMENINQSLLENSLFISNGKYISNLACTSTIKRHIVNYNNIICRDPESFLITYLEINGVRIEHNPKVEHYRDQNAIINPDVISKLQIIDGALSLFNTINGSRTERLKNELNERIFNPESTEGLMKWFDMMLKFRNNQGLSKIHELIKNFSNIRFIDHGCHVIESKNDVCTERKHYMSQSTMTYEPETSFLFDRSVSCYKSIYSKKNLEEKSIPSYKRTIKDVLRFKSNINILYRLGKQVSALNPDTEDTLLKEYLHNLKIYDQTISKEIKQAIDEIDDMNLENVWFLMDKYAFVVKPGVDAYLDLCRRNYEEKVTECQTLLVDMMKDTDLQIYMTDTREICMVRKIPRKFSENKSAENEYAKNEYVLNSTVTPKNRLFVIKESKTNILYSCVKLKAINKAIKETLDQIMEIEGRLCKSISTRLKKYSSVFVGFSKIISKMGLLVNCMILSRDFSYKKPVISDTVSIHNVVDCIHKDFKKVSYFFNEDTVHVITGANMAGKSCYVKNFVRISILVRIGMFIDCEYIRIPIYDEIYLIENIGDLNDLIKNILDKNVDIKCVYKTPKRLVVIDELHCSNTLLLDVLRMLKKNRILTLFITHNTMLIRMLKEDRFSMFTFENYRMAEGISCNNTVVNICSRFFPEIVDKLCEKLKNT